MKRRRRWLIPVIIIAVLFIYCLVTYLVTPHVIVRPTFNEEAASELNLIELEELFAEKQSLNIPLVEDIKVPSSVGDLRGWYLHQSSHTDAGKADLLLYFGGYNEDSATSALRFLHQMTDTDHFAGWDIAVVDWPGFGTSEGKPTDDNIRDASAAIYRYFRAKDNIRSICLMGYSFGTGPATYVASLYGVGGNDASAGGNSASGNSAGNNGASGSGVDGLILLAPYESAYNLYNSVTPVFYGPMKLLISFHMDEADYAESVSTSPLIIYSEADARIPAKYSQALAGHFTNEPIMVALPDTSHGDLTTDERALEAIDSYLHK